MSRVSALLLCLLLLLSSCTRSPASATTGGPLDPRSGHGLYDRYCKLCHGEGARGYAADDAPSLRSPTFLESVTDQYLAHGIRVGRPGTSMAAYGKVRGGPLSEPEIAAIIRYVRSLGPARVELEKQAKRGDPAHGSALFNEHCQRCHGGPTKPRTALDLRNPELVRTASLEFLRHAIEHGRPSTPMPAFKKKLSPTEIDDLVAWLSSPPPKPAIAPPSVQPSVQKVPKNPPLVLNPGGPSPKFTLRDGRYVPAQQVLSALKRKQRLIIIDARPTSDYQVLHIPGAVSIPYYDTASLSHVPNDGTWVVAYCACPHHASGQVVDALRERKFPRTAVLDEGILVWHQKGYPVAGQAVAPK